MPQNASDPEEIVRSMLEDLLAELRQKNTREISYYEALTMSYEAKIQNIFKNTYLLRYLDLTKLKHKEHSTCFFVNLANLMWIHAIFSFGEGDYMFVRKKTKINNEKSLMIYRRLF